MRGLDEIDRALGTMPSNLKTRMLAVRMAHSAGNPRKEIAGLFDASERTLRNWIDRFERDGIDGLRHSDGAGRQPAVSRKRIASHTAGAAGLP